jgi:prepilin-type processing-associated H-X9-DG protein
VQRIRLAADSLRCKNNLKQVGLALQHYHESHMKFPPGVSGDKPSEPRPFLSWCARLLPYLEADNIWREIESAFSRDRDFLHVPPHVYLGTPIKHFICPSDSRVRQTHKFPGSTLVTAFTSYLGVNGTDAASEDGVLYLDSGVRFADIIDGNSNTLAIGERPPSADFGMGWWYAGWGQHQDGETDMVLGTRTRNTSVWGEKCGKRGPFEFKEAKFTDPCAAFHFWSPHTGGAHFLLADGSVRFLRYSANTIIPALASRAGGEPVAVP